MVRCLVLLAGATLAQQHRPWNRLGERLGFPTPDVPKPVVDAIAAAKEFVDNAGATKDEHGCMLGGGYTWCEEKNKCLRVWEEPCKAEDTPVCAADEVICTTELQKQGMNCVVGNCVKAPVATPVCAADEVVCTTELQKQGMNCVVGNCVKVPTKPVEAASSVRAMVGRKDANGCAFGSGYSWCEAKKKCLRQWEEPCEATTNVPVCSDGQVVCTALLQKQGMNCAIGKCVAVPSSKPQAFGGKTRDVHGCVSGGGYKWCESKKKCTREWEEACEEVAPQPVGGAQDNHGCVKGGGYQWCEGKQKCLRLWEEACEEETPKPMGGTQDNHGCVLGGGYQWCESKQKCLRSWEEPCEEETPKPMGGTQDNHGCVLGGGYQWCESKQKCLRSWEEPCEEEASKPVGGAQDNHGCVLGGGYQWCESKQKCLRSWEEPCKTEELEPVGGAQDNHGCVKGGGYQWCEGKQKCLRLWEEACEEEEKPAIPTIPNLLHSVLTLAQREDIKTFMAEVQAKQARYMAGLKQKMADVDQNEAFEKMSEALRARMNRMTAALKGTEKIGAHEDRRVDPVAHKNDAEIQTGNF